MVLLKLYRYPLCGSLEKLSRNKSVAKYKEPMTTVL
jgi:hypothetical protein